MHLIQLSNAGDYAKVVAAVMSHGRLRSPRGLVTRDLGYTIITLDNVYSALPIGVGRKVNTAIAAIEALQLIAGVARHDLVLKVAPQFEAYTDDLETVNGDLIKYFHGAYGARVGFQVMCAVDKLKKDPDTRQAVITLWDPYQDNLPGKHDYPCTVMLAFSIRDEKVELDVVMRSNDVWLGLPYDMFQFTQLQLSACYALNREPGQYRHTALSMHAYECNFDDIARFLVTDQERTYPQHFQPMGLGANDMPFFKIMHQAQSIMNGETSMIRTRSHQWYYDKIHGARDVTS